MTHLSVRGLWKGFGATPVLKGIDVDIPSGSLTAILGSSGCGKTTFLRLIAGFTDPDAGTISFDDREIVGPTGSVPARRRQIGFVPQEGALFPHLTVAANVTFGLPRADRKAGRRLTELLDLVGLSSAVARRYPHELSGGQQQRAALARALAPEPAVVLLDEPFSSLDAGLREDTGNAVAQVLRATGATTVLVTHDQHEALSLADQVAVMRGGRLVQVAAPDELYRRPADTAVASFVGGAVLLPGMVMGGQVSCALGCLELDHAATEISARDAQVLIRPEQIRLGTNGVRARVVDVSYYGYDAAVRLELVEGGIRVVARVAGSAVPHLGDTVRLTVHGPVPLVTVP